MSCINESEMLRAFEIAMMSIDDLPTGTDHVIAGLQPSQLAKSINAAKADTFWMLDNRLRSLLAATGTYSKMETAAANESIVALINGASSEEDAIDAVVECLIERLSRLLMINAVDIKNVGKSLANYGLDSMIGAEFRNWIFREFKVNVPFQQLLAGNVTIAKLAADLCGKVRETGED